MFLIPLLLTLATSAKPALLAAHRGGIEFGPENTLEGMRGTLQNVPECRVMEFDVQLSSDGVAYLMHDTTVDRTTNGTGPLSALTSAQVDALTVDAGVNAGVRVPRLVDVLRLVKRHPGVVVWCESKSDVVTTVPVIAQAVRDAGFPQRRFFGAWFGPLPAWKQYLPEYAGMVLVSGSTPREYTAAQLSELRNVHGVDTIVTWGNGSAFTPADAAAMNAAGMRGGPISGTPSSIGATLDAGTQVFLTDWPAACRNAYLTHHWEEWKQAHGVSTTVTKSTAARTASGATQASSLLTDYAVGAEPTGAATGADFQFQHGPMRARLALGPWPLRVAGIHAEYSADLRTWTDCPPEWLDYPLDTQAVEITPPVDAPRFFLRLMIDP